jgi:hypothetical protein
LVSIDNCCCVCSLKHQNKKPEYIKDWWNVVNWRQVSDNYALAKDGRDPSGATTAGRLGVNRPV